MVFDSIELMAALHETPQYRVGRSQIAGRGAFISSACPAGINLGVAVRKVASTGRVDEDYERTELGAFTNHSDSPNTRIVRSGDMYIFVTATDLRRGEEITVDYREFDFEGKRDFARNKEH